MVRKAFILAIVGLALLLASDAGAVGGVIGSSSEPITVGLARFAIAMSDAQTTRWASIQVEKFPGAMAWLVPVRPGARVDEVSDAWFEALELATAPRVVAPSCGTAPPAPARIEGLPDRVPTQLSLESVVIDDVPALRAFASERALEVPAEIEARFDDLRARGFAFAAFLYAGPVGGGFTRTVRVTDDAFPSVPLFMTLGVKSPVRVTAFLIGASRARLGAGSEMEIDPASVTFAGDGTTNYRAVLTQELLAGNGLGWVVEASEPDLFLTGARGPAGIDVTAPIAPTYDQRAASYGDPPSDLTLALDALDPAKVWVTRVAGMVPAGAFGDDVAVTVAAGPAKSPFLLTTRPPPDCTPAVLMPPPPPSEPPSNPPREQRPVVVGTTVVESPLPQEVNVSGSCDGSPASQPQESTSSDDSCGHSDDSSDSSASDDGCDSSSDQPADESDDGCDSSSSDSSPDQSSSGCDSGNSSGSSSSDCSVSHRSRRRRSHTSLVVWAMCGVLSFVRRWSRSSSSVAVSRGAR